MTQDTTVRLEHVARAYESAITACMLSIIDETPGLTDGLRDVLPSKEAALTDCLSHIDHVPCNSPEEAGLLPLLFIVACETNNVEQMRTVQRRVAILETHVGLGNIRSAATLLRQIWLGREQSPCTDWRTVLELSDWDLITT